MTTALTIEETFVVTALKSWEAWVGRADKFFASLSDQQMQLEVAPGKNRALYLLGHLTAVHDSMIPQLRLGEAEYPQLRETFIAQPDRAVSDLPSTAELRKYWKDVNLRLASLFAELSPTQWLERHGTVSEEDFAKEPHRNRLAILLSRTSHASYHLGQLLLLNK